MYAYQCSRFLLQFLYVIPWEVLRIDSCACQIGQSAFSEVEFEEIAHQRLHGVFGFDLDLFDSAFEALQIVAVVVVGVQSQEALAFVVVEVT